MRAFQSDQMAMAEHLHADVATIQQLKDTGRQLLRAELLQLLHKPVSFVCASCHCRL